MQTSLDSRLTEWLGCLKLLSLLEVLASKPLGFSVQGFRVESLGLLLFRV